jgi:hypothetical protein
MVSKISDVFRYDSLSNGTNGDCIASLEIDSCEDSGVGQAYWQVILGRIVQGCGASGIISLASIIITGKIISLFHFPLSLSLQESDTRS